MAAAPTVLPIPPAGADPGWRLDLSARGIGSVELTSSAEQMRAGFVPAFAVRALHRVGSMHVGGTIGGGFPAWYGKAEAALSVDRESVLAEPHCEVARNGFEEINDIVPEQCRGARWSFAAGLDVGVGLHYYDAPPETPSTSNALVYWGPLVRARLQLHVLDVLPTSRAVGVVVGANAAFTAARYSTTASGSGLRFEPEVEVGITMRL